MKLKLTLITALFAALLVIPSMASAALSWTAAATPTGTPNLSIASAVTFDSTNSRLVAVGDTGSASKNVYVSTNGTSWTANDSFSHDWVSVAYGNGKYVAAAHDGAIMYSTNGTSWTMATSPSCSPSCSWNKVSFYYGTNTWVIAGYGSANNNLATSSNGTTWSLVSPSPAGDLRDAFNNNGAWYVIGVNGPNTVFSYTNNLGSAFTNYLTNPNPSGTAPTGMATGGLKAAYSSGNTVVLVGPAGLFVNTNNLFNTAGSWAASPTTPLTLTDVIGVSRSSSSKWIMAALNGTTATSSDGITWTSATPITVSSPGSVMGITGIDQGNGPFTFCKFVAVGSSTAQDSAFWSTDDATGNCSGGGGGGGGGYTNTVAPTATQSGCTLTLTNGQWTPTPSAFTYRWDRVSRSGPPVTVGNSQSLTITSADTGNAYQGMVTATGAAGMGFGSTLVTVRTDCAAGGSSSSTSASSTSTSGALPKGPALKVADVPKEITVDIGTSDSGTVAPNQPITAEVPCSAPEGTTLSSCSVNITAPQTVLLGQGDGISVRADKRVSIGKATVNAKTGKKIIIVKVKINQTGRKALQRNLKITAKVGLTAVTVARESSTGEATTEMQLPTQLLSPQAGIFEAYSTTLNKAGVQFVNRLAQLLPKHPKKMVFIGFADNTGVPGDNRWLGDRRAKAVRDALAARGIVAVKSEIESKAARSPRDDNSKESGRERNRRVSIRITY